MSHPLTKALWGGMGKKPEAKLESKKSTEKEAPSEKELLAFFKKNPNPEDDVLHKWAEKHGYEPDEVEDQVYRMVTKFASFADNGKAKEKGVAVADVDQKQLQMGIKVEHEHTTSSEMAKRIALDHLAEIPDYYTRLDKMEKAAKKKE